MRVSGRASSGHNALSSYPTYRLSGTEWIGDIPDHWEVRRLKHCSSLPPAYGANEPAEKYADEGVRFLRTSDIDEFGHLIQRGAVYLPFDAVSGYLLEPGDLLLSRSGTVGRCFVYQGNSDGRCAFAGYLVRFRLTARLLPSFAFYFTKSGSFKQWLATSAIESTIGNVNGQRFANLPLCVPPHSEQVAVVAFLDRETAKIDALIAKKQRLIELLEEKRAALISHAVTKGLDPNVPMKDSGIEWLGQIPAHWEVTQLKWAVTFQRGHDLSSDNRDEGTVPVVSSCGVSGRHSEARAKAPGIVTGRYGSIGQFYLMREAYWPLNTTLYSIDLHGNAPEFILYMLQHLAPLFLLNGVKSAVPGVDRNDIHPVATAVPPVPEQGAIVEFLDAEALRLDRMVAKVNEVIERLREYRTALISAAVTGKIDVREAV